MIKATIKILLLSCLVIVLHSAPLLAQGGDDQARFEHLTVEDGLSNSAVLLILQDREGFMWFGTLDGLNKYDGYEMTVYRHSDDPRSLSANMVMAGIEASDGTLWFGTDPGGLNRYDRATDQFTVYKHDPADPNSLGNDSIWAIHEDHNGILWLGTRGGLSRFDPQTGQFKTYKPDPENPRALSHTFVLNIFEDSQNTLWVGTRGGLNRFDPETDDFTVYRPDPADPGSISSEQPWSIFEDNQGTLWIGTRGGGLNKFNREDETFTAYRADPADPHSLNDDNVWRVFEDSQGTLWIGTERGGLNKFDRQTEQFNAYQHNPNDPLSLNNNDIFAIHEDRAGVLWLGSRNQGISKLYPSLQRFKLYRHIPESTNSLNVNNINGLLVDQEGTLWIGTRGGGLNKVDRARDEVTHYVHQPDNPDSIAVNDIYVIHQDEAGLLWLGTQAGGLIRFDPATEIFTAYQDDPNNPDDLSTNFITSIVPAGDGQFWLGTLGFGLTRLDPATGQAVHYKHDPDDPRSLSEDTIYVMEKDQAGRLWIGTARGGLSIFDPAAGQFTNYRADPDNPASLSDNSVYVIYQDEAGIGWLGTAGGLNRFDPASGAFITYHRQDGLPNETIYGILPDDEGNLWLSTGRGLSKFNPQTETFRSFDVRDGLQSSQFNLFSYHRSPAGELFFGGPNGLNAFFPAQISDNPTPPPVVLTGFQLFNEPVAIGSEPLPRAINLVDELVLNYDQSVFSFEFAALNYQISAKNRYQYKMEGFNQDWSPPGDQRQATYTNLDPGQYTFMVRAANNDGVWNDTPKSIDLTIMPPWWQTAWFRSLALIAVVGAAVAGVQWRVSSIKARNRELETRVAERTLELSQSNRQLQQEIEQRTRAEAALRQAKNEAEHAREEAEQANQAKSVFLATMSHELRTPLNGILGYAQILKRDVPASPRLHGGLNTIQQSGEHLLGLINDVLDLSKIEAGKVDLFPGDVILASLLHAVGEIIQVRAAAKEIDFKLEAAPDLPVAIRVDERRLRQVLINLLSNAVKFTEQGHVAFGVEQLTEAATGAPEPVVTLRFTIEDTGIGIAPQDLESIFDPFQQAGSGQQRAKGTGLGLSISRNLLALMGSELHVTSTLGKGSTFWFDLSVPVIGVEDPEETLEPQQITGIKGTAPRILVVDDDAANRRVVIDMLAPLGFDIRETETVQAALAQVRQNSLDAVITDLILPEQDGFYLIEQLRQDPVFDDLPIIASSASVLEGDQQKSLQAGANAFVPKPVQLDQLLQTLQQQLGLAWQYADPYPEAPAAPLSLDDVTLPAETLATLTELANIGDIRGLRRQAELLQQDEALKPFGLELGRLARSVDLDKIKALLNATQSRTRPF